MGKMSKSKGAVGEREAAKIAREHGFGSAARGRQYHGGPDTPDVVGIPGIHPEVKRVEKLNLRSAMAQSVNDAADGEIPVVIHRKNHEPWYITFSFESFLDMYKELLDYRETAERMEDNRK